MRPSISQTILVGLMICFGMSASVSASSLRKCTRLELGAGIRQHTNRNITEVRWAGVEVLTSSGAVGVISLSHWDNENLAYAITYSVHDVESSSWVDWYDDLIEETSVVHSLMFGFRFYLPQSRPYSSMRPYFSMGAGPFIGTTVYSEVDARDCEHYSEVENMTVLAARVGGGVDFQMNRHFMLGFTAGYNFVDDFPRPIGGPIHRPDLRPHSPFGRRPRGGNLRSPGGGGRVRRPASFR